jgi:hypothetical protein
MTDTDDFDLRVRQLVYAHFAATGTSPAVAAIAESATASVADVRRAFQRLRQNRVLFLEPDGTTIRMAPPFSGVPTQHRVLARGREYFANCAWDALGVAAALQSDAMVLSECAQSHEPLRLRVALTGPEQSEWLFHCLVPAAKWWDDLVFT